MFGFWGEGGRSTGCDARSSYCYYQEFTFAPAAPQTLRTGTWFGEREGLIRVVSRSNAELDGNSEVIRDFLVWGLKVGPSRRPSHRQGWINRNTDMVDAGAWRRIARDRVACSTGQGGQSRGPEGRLKDQALPL